MDFDERLQRALHRGQSRNQEKRRKAEAAALSEEELKRLHSKIRLELSEHIEECVKRVPMALPGFQFETIYGDRGWGAACSRDDLRINAGRRNNDFSRLEVTIRPFTEYHVIDLASKGTVRNKEIFNRSHFEKIEDVDPQSFIDLIDVWVLEFVELFAASN